MKILDWLRFRGQSDDEPDSEQLAEVAGLIPLWRSQLSVDTAGALDRLLASDTDEVPGAHGRFGFDATNPIRANGPRGEVIYLERLVAPSGGKVLYHRLGAVDTQSMPGLPVDVYEILPIGGQQKRVLHFSIYSSRRSRVGPSGFSLKSWSRLTPLERTFVKLGACGSTAKVDAFPESLPDVVGSRLYSSGLPQQVVESIISTLRRAVPGGVRPVDASAMSPDEQFELGCKYSRGEGVARDDSQAFLWYRLAAEQGLPEAQFNLGIMYSRGQGVAKDDSQAVFWYRLAAERGLPKAQFNLGGMHLRGDGTVADAREAVFWWRLSAEQGFASAQYNLGKALSRGEGVKLDNEESVRWLRLAAEQGHVEAQYELGAKLFQGEGVARNAAESLKWFRAAAEAGEMEAQCMVGLMHMEGIGVAEDAPEAARWLALAAAQGDAHAQHYLRDLRRKGGGVENGEREGDLPRSGETSKK